MESLTASLRAFSVSVEGLPIPQFVSLDPKYLCVKCSLPLNQARQLPCGHRICRPCVDKLFSSSGSRLIVCPSGEDDCRACIGSDEVGDVGVVNICVTPIIDGT